ncbi:MULTISPECIES: LytR/AlgR family response regulator transcription factor [Streptomyces]|uniref:LytR family transcriptional regulator n=1 Tax=Streptomyces viridochromogenes TaxID=1938 RepID=A0A0L8J989_STRVR|nr:MULTISPECIES: LytTR family DNA-binding domain-containing protein [Streptomyces]KOG10262.1 LytR family transcriptional regulator [Streptomyces viridochromogenes]
MLRVLAVDDEEPALEELLYLLRADARVGHASGVLEATEALRLLGQAMDCAPESEEGIDVVLLDVGMPGLSGLDVARLLAGFSSPPHIVFVTAHEDFAVQAFELHAVDYLLKPLRKERLAEALRRVTELVERRPPAPAVRHVPSATDTSDRWSAPEDTDTGPPVPSDRVAVELAGSTRFLPIAEITFAEAQGDYARLHTRNGTTHLIRIPLSQLEERWRARGFVRIHRRHLVSLASIDELRLDAGIMTARVGANVLTISRRNARELRDLLVRQARDGQSTGSRRSGGHVP